MSDATGMLTTQQFALQAKVAIATISKWLRSGKIKGVKQNGKWMISADQLASVEPSDDESSQVKKNKAVHASSEAKTCAADFSIEEFSAMTYLTCFGIERFIKEGRLSAAKNASGMWRVDADNLERKDLQHLRRK